MKNKFSHLSNLVVLVYPEQSINSAISLISKRSKEVKNKGLALVINKNYKLLGILTDGDIRRAYVSKISFNKSVSEIMVSNPLSLNDNIPFEDIIMEVRKLAINSKKLSSDWIRYIPIIDNDGYLLNIHDYFDLLQTRGSEHKKVAVFGLGFVGITLAVALANRGHQLTGIEVNEELLEKINKGELHVHEPGLNDMLNSTIRTKKIKFDISITDKSHEIYIIAVGSPLDSLSRPDLKALNSVLEIIGPLLKKGDLVLLRSTVPCGTTRDFVIPKLEQLSSMLAGEDFHIAFSPERTVEGKAMQELRTLPQIIGGFSSRCLQLASNFWSTLTPTVVQVASIEAGELVKLANNTFRDLSFAFANELALLADTSNINAFDLINAANKGYPRNNIPLPSPGVGGYCLTKDPILFGSTLNGPIPEIILGRSSREVNERAAMYPIEILNRYSNRINKPLIDFTVLIIGLAFKGNPETNDLRGSVSLDISNFLKDKVHELLCWDAVVKHHEIEKQGLNPISSLDIDLNKVDAILMLNNHKLNIKFNWSVSSLGSCLIFDGWSQLDVSEIEKIHGLTYATMGYMSPN